MVALTGSHEETMNCLGLLDGLILQTFRGPCPTDAPKCTPERVPFGILHGPVSHAPQVDMQVHEIRIDVSTFCCLIFHQYSRCTTQSQQNFTELGR